MGELYCLEFKSGKSYIGITRRTAKERFEDHRRAAHKSQKGVVYKAWRKHGEPCLKVLRIIDDYKDLLVAEVDAIKRFNTRFPFGYNMTDGGDVPPSLSVDIAAKISAKLKGRKLSKEHCQSISLGGIGRKHSDQAIENMKLAQKGKTFSQEAKKKMSIAKIGRSINQETKEKMAESQRKRRRLEGYEPQKPRINYPRKKKAEQLYLRLQEGK